MNIEITEIQKNIEEKRLILGKKLEDFLLKKLCNLKDFLKKILASKSLGFFGCFAVILLSILANSYRDIGYESAEYLEITKKILDGKTTYKDFTVNSPPLVFYLNIAANFLAKILTIDPIIGAIIFSNLIGILSIYFSSRILKRSNFFVKKNGFREHQTFFNLLIISFACGFFLRIFTLQFGELLTKSSYFLALSYPYISYQFLKNSELKTRDQIILGAIAALFFLLKPSYIVLMTTFEISKILQKKSLKPFFCLRNYCTFLLIIFYFLILNKYLPEFKFRALDIYHYSNYIHIIKEYIFLPALSCYLCFFLIKKFDFLQPLFLAFIAGAKIIFLDSFKDLNQMSIFFSLSSPLIIMLLALILKGNYVNWRRDLVLISAILFLPQFDQNNIFALIFDLCAFWWIFAFALSKENRNKLSKKNITHIKLWEKAFLPASFDSWLIFLSSAAITITLIIYKNTAELSWLISEIFFILLVNFNQKLHEKDIKFKEFSTLSAAMLALAISYVISLYFAAIFNYSNSIAFKYKSPNYLSDEVIKVAKKFSNQDDEIIILSASVLDAYPIFNYLKKENPLISNDILSLYKNINSHTKTDLSLTYLKQALQNQKTKLVFVTKKGSNIDDQCQIGFLEFYLRDEEFRKIFLTNYKFLNRIIDKKIVAKKTQFFNESTPIEAESEFELIKKDVEIYVRK